MRGHEPALTGHDEYDCRSWSCGSETALFDIVNVQIWPAAPLSCPSGVL
jgi:hypothetical protein